MASGDPVCAAPSPFPCLLPTPLLSLTSRPNRQWAPLRASAGYPGAGAVGSRQGGGTAGRCPDSPPPPRPPPAPGARSCGAALRCLQSSRRQRPASPCAPAAAPFVRGASASRAGGREGGLVARSADLPGPRGCTGLTRQPAPQRGSRRGRGFPGRPDALRCSGPPRYRALQPGPRRAEPRGGLGPSGTFPPWALYSGLRHSVFAGVFKKKISATQLYEKSSPVLAQFSKWSFSLWWNI